ncbi:hypothetical protein KAJ27_10065 [bacterium]|nr:hypothetical protein [bacterium]
MKNNDIRIDNKSLFTLLIIIQIIILWGYREFVLSLEMVSSLYSDLGYNTNQMQKYLSFAEKISLLSFFILPLWTLLKITITALFIQMFFIIRHQEIPLNKCIFAAGIATFALLSERIAQYIGIFLLNPENINQYALNTIPLSLQSFLQYDLYPVYLWGLFGKINIFVILWIALLAVIMTKLKFDTFSNTLFLSFGLWALTYISTWGFLSIIYQIT